MKEAADLFKILSVDKRIEIIELLKKDPMNVNSLADKLGVTPAAISQYVSGKRGKVKIIDEKILKEIKNSAEQIVKNGQDHVINETCRICKIMKKDGIFSFQCDACAPVLNK